MWGSQHSFGTSPKFVRVNLVITRNKQEPMGAHCDETFSNLFLETNDFVNLPWIAQNLCLAD